MDDAARGVDKDTDEDARTREIRKDIAQTREQMSETIEAIQERLSPGYIATQATETVKNAASRKAQQMANTAGDAADYVLESSFIQTLRSNPVPAALIGIGTAWLLMKGRSDSDRARFASYRRYDSRPDWRNPGAGRSASVGGYRAGTPGADTTGAATSAYGAGDFGGSAGADYSGSAGAQYTGGAGAEYSGSTGAEYSGGEYQAGGSYERRGYEADAYRSSDYRRGSSGLGYASGSMRSNPGSQMSFERVVRDNPLALGAAAVLVGAAIGMSLPSTEAENQFMGEARDSVVDRAREMAGDAADKVSEVATQAKDMASRAVESATSSAAVSTQSGGASTPGGSTGGSQSVGGSTDTSPRSDSTGADGTDFRRQTGPGSTRT